MGLESLKVQVSVVECEDWMFDMFLVRILIGIYDFVY